MPKFDERYTRPTETRLPVRDKKGRFVFMQHEYSYPSKRPTPKARSSSPTQYSKPFKYKLKSKSLKPREKYGTHYPNRYEVGQGGSKGLSRMKRMK